MKQPITILTKNIKAIVIPNDILEKFENPEFFDLIEEDGKVILTPIKKKKEDKTLIDNSLDLYNIG
jgi:virulence-associated protein VagC